MPPTAQYEPEPLSGGHGERSQVSLCVTGHCHRGNQGPCEQVATECRGWELSEQTEKPCLPGGRGWLC